MTHFICWFYHDVFFGFVWCKMLECYIHRALRRKDIIWSHIIMVVITCSTRRPPPLKLEKIWFFTWNTPKISRPHPPYNWKNMIFWRKIVIFSHEIPKFFFFSSPPLTWDPGSVPGICISKLIISFVNNYLS